MKLGKYIGAALLIGSSILTGCQCRIQEPKLEQKNEKKITAKRNPYRQEEGYNIRKRDGSTEEIPGISYRNADNGIIFQDLLANGTPDIYHSVEHGTIFMRRKGTQENLIFPYIAKWFPGIKKLNADSQEGKRILDKCYDVMKSVENVEKKEAITKKGFYIDSDNDGNLDYFIAVHERGKMAYKLYPFSQQNDREVSKEFNPILILSIPRNSADGRQLQEDFEYISEER